MTTTTEVEKLVYTIVETAKLLGLSKGSAYQLAKEGKLPGLIRLGERRLAVSKLGLQKFLEGNGEDKL